MGHSLADYGLWGSLWSPGQHRPALHHVTIYIFLASLYFPSSPFPPGLAHPKAFFALIFASGSVRTKVKETSVGSHSALWVSPLHNHLSIYASDNEPHAKRSCAFVICILSPEMESSRHSADAWISEWMNWLFNYPGILGSKLTCSGSLSTTAPPQCVMCIYTFPVLVLLFAFVLKGRIKRKRWINVFKDLGSSPDSSLSGCVTLD